MDLNQNLEGQLDAIVTFFRNYVEENPTPPSVEMWKEKNEAIIEIADFIDRYVTPKVVRMMSGERLSLKVAPLVRPEPTDLEMHPEESSVGTPFLFRNGQRDNTPT